MHPLCAHEDRGEGGVVSRHKGLPGGATDEEPAQSADVGLQLTLVLHWQDHLHQGNDIHIHL